ncbi:MAG TPA: hypothetical protein VN957_03840 [Chthoniobacterales bacterium]|jgi:hypothetical protein|nr:hypothetical protein [Chthoniobacterales bacterium]
MNRIQKKTTYSIRASSICKVIVAMTFAAVAGLSYVYLKNQLTEFGHEQIVLEKELADLQRDNQIIESTLGSLSSRRELMKSLAKDSRGLIPITTDQVVRLNQGHGPVGNELRIVSNRAGNQ